MHLVGADAPCVAPQGYYTIPLLESQYSYYCINGKKNAPIELLLWLTKWIKRYIIKFMLRYPNVIGGYG